MVLGSLVTQFPFSGLELVVARGWERSVQVASQRVWACLYKATSNTVEMLFCNF